MIFNAAKRETKDHEYIVYGSSTPKLSDCNGDCNGKGYEKSFTRYGIDNSTQVLGCSANFGTKITTEHIPDKSCSGSDDNTNDSSKKK